MKEKTNLLISKTPPKLTKIGAKTGQKQRSLLTESLSTLRCPAYICAAFDTTSRWRRFARGLRRELFSRGFPARIYEQFVWYEPLYSRWIFCAVDTNDLLWKRDGKERMREEKKNNNCFKCQKRDVWFEENTQKKKKEIRRRKHTRQTLFYNTTVHINELPNYTL